MAALTNFYNLISMEKERKLSVILELWDLSSWGSTRVYWHGLGLLFVLRLAKVGCLVACLLYHTQQSLSSWRGRLFNVADVGLKSAEVTALLRS